MNDVHRPSLGCPVYSDRIVEIDEHGEEVSIPLAQACPARVSILRDETVRWIRRDEAARLEGDINDALADARAQFEAGKRGTYANYRDVRAVLARSGIDLDSGTALQGVIEYGVEERRVLCRRAATDEYASVVLIAKEFEDGYHLDSAKVEYYDHQRVTMILRLARRQVALAREHGLLCRDAVGHHAQVILYYSAIVRCMTREGYVSLARLRRFWSEQVQADAAREAREAED